MRYAARRPIFPGETMPGTQPGLPRNPLQDPSKGFNVYRGYPGFNPFYMGAEEAVQPRRFPPPTRLDPQSMQRLSDAAISWRGRSIGGAQGGAGQGAGIGQEPMDLLKRMLMERAAAGY